MVNLCAAFLLIGRIENADVTNGSTVLPFG